MERMWVELKVSLEDIRQASADARINLTAQEEARLEEQIARLFEQWSSVQANGLDRIKAAYYPYTRENILREDAVRPSLPLETVMLNAPDADTNFFHVPKIVE